MKILNCVWCKKEELERHLIKSFNINDLFVWRHLCLKCNENKKIYDNLIMMIASLMIIAILTRWFIIVLLIIMLFMALDVEYEIVECCREKKPLYIHIRVINIVTRSYFFATMMVGYYVMGIKMKEHI